MMPLAMAGCGYQRRREADVTEARAGGPTVLRMILARQLQALREKAGMSYEQAAEAIYASPGTVRRMERAEGGLKPLSVKGLLLAYGITDVREIDAFLALAREASTPGWWHSYNDVLPLMLAKYCGPALLGLGITALIAILSQGLVVDFLARSWEFGRYTLPAIPVSVSQALVGAVFGLGLARGIQTIKLKILGNIVIGWIAAPVISGGLTYLLLPLLLRLS